MVQKKAPDRHGSPAESKRSHVKPQKRLQHHHHQDDGGGGGGGELKKMLKKSRSIKALEESLESPLGTQLVRLGKPAPQKKKKRPPPLVLPGAEPNYMKSTSSSKAKKEQAQMRSSFTPSMAAVGYKNRTPKNTKAASDQMKNLSSGGTSGLKTVRLLARKSSLRPVRPSMKRSLGIPLSPKFSAGRATCSSIMKETKFPDHLDLSPGGTEAEGTSVLKVCPYTYCSLNGHRHPPLPPLKCFLSARRRLLKTQKSMKLRGLTLFPKPAPQVAEEEMAIGTGPAELPRVSSLVEDLGDDFFVEIYTKPPKDILEPPGCGDDDDPIPVAVGGTPSAGDGGHDSEAKVEQDGKVLIDDSVTEAASNDDFDEISDFSPSEMEVLINFLEYVECDLEEPTSFTQDYADWSCDCYFRADSSRLEKGLGVDEGEHELVASEADDLDWGEDYGLHFDFDEVDQSEFSEEESSDGISFQFNSNGVTSNGAPLDVLFSLPCEEDAEEVVAEAAGERVSEFNINVEASDAAEGQPGEYDLTEVWDKISKSVGTGFDEEIEQEDVVEISESVGGAASDETVEAASFTPGDDPMGEINEGEQEDKFEEQEAEALAQGTEELAVVSNTEPIGDPFYGNDIDGDEEIEQEDVVEISVSVGGAASDETVEAASFTPGDDPMGERNEGEQEDKFEEQEAEALAQGTEELAVVSNTEPIGDPFYGNDIDGENSNVQVEEAEICEEVLAQGNVEKDQDEASSAELGTRKSEEEGESPLFDEMPVESDEKFGPSELCTATTTITECPQDGAAFTITETSLVEDLTDTSDYNRIIITRKKANGDAEEELRPFNPRPPNFLPVEPDPEAEKVDLRHQLMDERKNAEEWMVDYALQQAVNKLAPGRKRKVALLVEAFETVKPIPNFGSQLRQSMAGFTHARPIQACS